MRTGKNSKLYHKHDGSILSNYDNAEEIAQEAAMWHSIGEASQSQEERQNKDTKVICKLVQRR